MMIAIALIGIVIYAVRWTIFGGTVYAPGYDEGRFRQIRVGMTAEEVETLMGPPLRKLPWPPQDWPYQQGLVTWCYTGPQPWTSKHYWQRDVIIKDNNVIRMVDTYLWPD